MNATPRFISILLLGIVSRGLAQQPAAPQHKFSLQVDLMANGAAVKTNSATSQQRGQPAPRVAPGYEAATALTSTSSTASMPRYRIQVTNFDAVPDTDTSFEEMARKPEKLAEAIGN